MKIIEYFINNKKIFRWIKLVIILGIFGMLFVKFPVEKLMDALLGINIGFAVLGVSLGYLSTFLYTFFMWIVVQEKQIQITLIRLYKINLEIKFYSLFSPTSLVGSGIRLYRLAENHRVEDALSAITFSRFMDIIVTLIDGTFWIIISLYNDKFNLWWIGIFLFAVVCLWIIFLKISSPTIKLLDKILDSPKVHNYIKKSLFFIKKYAISLSEFRTIPFRKVILLVLTSLVYDLFNTTIHYSFVRALHIPLAFATLAWIRSVIAIASLIPLNTFGGLGVREISTYVLMTANGVSPELAIAFSVMNYVRISLLGLTGGIIELIDTFRSKEIRKI